MTTRPSTRESRHRAHYLWIVSVLLPLGAPALAHAQTTQDDTSEEVIVCGGGPDPFELPLFLESDLPESFDEPALASAPPE